MAIIIKKITKKTILSLTFLGGFIVSAVLHFLFGGFTTFGNLEKKAKNVFGEKEFSVDSLINVAMADTPSDGDNKPSPEGCCSSEGEEGCSNGPEGSGY